MSTIVKPGDRRGWRVYSVEPIDMWGGYLTWGEVLSQISGETDRIPDRWGVTVEALCTRMNEALDAIRAQGWDGYDVRDGVYVAPVAGLEREYIFLLKQSDNGTVWVASPVDLPYLQ